MIRLIVSDLDGTLLNTEKALPMGFCDTVRTLKAHDILFCAASGRQYWSLVEQFTDIKDDMLFIAENGAIAMNKGERLLIEPLPTKDMPRLIQAVRGMPNVKITICCEDDAFFEADEAFGADMRDAYPHSHAVPDLMPYAHRADICKISVCDQLGSEKNSYPILKAMFPDWQVVLSGENFCDVMKKGVNKGTALHGIKQALQISNDECMAFGDYLNDLGLFEEATNSYAMQNAHPLLKQRCKYIAPSNDEEGVMQVLRRQFAFLNT